MSGDAAAPEGGEFVSVQEAASLLGISRVRMRQIALERQLEVFASPVDRRVRLFRRAEVEALRRPRPLRRDDDGPKMADAA